jgi:hypothetical protein
MQGDDVARFQCFLPRRIEGTEPAFALVRREDGLHAERLADLRHALAEHALADDPQSAAAQVPDRMVEEADNASGHPHSLGAVTA